VTVVGLKGEWTFIPLCPGPFAGSSKQPQASRAMYASSGSQLIAAFSGMRGRMRRPGRLPVLVLMTMRKGGGYPLTQSLRWLRVLFGVKSIMDRLAMPALCRCTVLQEEKKSCLPNMRQNGKQLWKSKEPNLGSIQPLCSQVWSLAGHCQGKNKLTERQPA
jgi:hypothetical protein